ncbi:MAG: tetratricopeptide repeat protein [Ignavibacteriales bacterium]|nr:tetratricopeptide repeat protein [Ignavibacteriales bacterium]
MRALMSLTLVVMLAIGITGCTKKADDGKIPITTASNEAKKEFMEGRDLAEKALLANSIQHFDKAIALDSGFALAYLNRAIASLIPKDFHFYLMKAVALKEQCTEGERLLILSTEAGRSANTVKQKEYLDKLITLYPNDERVHLRLGLYYQGQQEYRPAIEHFKKAIEIEPKSSPAYNYLGYAYRQIENYSEAENAFKKYIELIPNEPNPYDSYAELLLKMGRFDESIANYQKALKVDQTFFNARIGIAANYMYKGEYENGSAELKKLSDMAHNDGERGQMLFSQTVLYVDAGKMDMALLELKKLNMLDEKANDVTGLADDFGIKGAILLDMGKYNDALTAYEKSEQLIASSDLSQKLKENAQLTLHFNRAAVALEIKDLKKAKAETEEVRKTAEANKNLNQLMRGHQLTGSIAFAEKEYEKAVSELLQTNQQNPRNLYRLALAYQAMGDKVKAKEFCKKAAKFNSMPGLEYAFIRMKAEKLLSTM